MDGPSQVQVKDMYLLHSCFLDTQYNLDLDTKVSATQQPFWLVKNLHKQCRYSQQFKHESHFDSIIFPHTSCRRLKNR